VGSRTPAPLTAERRCRRAGRRARNRSSIAPT
jgi:hypothetical protein